MKKWRVFDMCFFAALAETARQGVQFHPEPNSDYEAQNIT